MARAKVLNQKKFPIVAKRTVAVARTIVKRGAKELKTSTSTLIRTIGFTT
jgi:hypothetical protein